MKTVQKSILICATALVTTVTASAQEIGDLLRYSQYNYSFSTARSAAMGGAFTSLGADLSSMSMNPAGLGMYRSSEVLIAPQVSSASMKSNYFGGKYDENKTKFTLGSMGVALNLMNGNGALTSFTLGVGYNKLADFHTSSFVNGYNVGPSMTDNFAAQVNGYAPDFLGPTTGGADDWAIPFNQLATSYWGGILAYQTNMLRNIDPSNNTYAPAWGYNTAVNNSLHNINKGNVGEFTISGGFNFNNRVYLGLTIGIQDLYYRNDNIYSEISSEYLGDGSLDGFSYSKTNIQTGTGVNFKFGLIVRPIDNLRIGVAVHTPTFTSMEYKYIENMYSQFNSPSDLGRNYDSPAIVNDYNINSAPRLLTGISYAQPGIGLISIDYERVWYNGMRIRNFSWSHEDYIKASVKKYYKAANNVRVGLELTPTQNLFVRGGFAYYDDCMRQSNETLVNALEINSYNNYSAGLGYRFSNNMSLDFSYVYSDYKYANSEAFWEAAEEGGLIKTKQNRNTFILALGFRF